MLKEKFYSSLNSINLSEVITSQDNSSFLSCTNKASTMRTNQIKIKRSQIQISSDTSIEELSDDNSDEVSSKRQKLTESVRNTNKENLNDDNTVTFQRNTLIAEQQNYHLISESAENESSNTNLRARSETANNYQSNSYKHEGIFFKFFIIW